MASKEIIIDDDYCIKMGNYFLKQGNQIDKFIAEYINILQSIRDTAIVSGETANALRMYIEYAKRLNMQIGNVSENVQKQLNRFLVNVDSADQFLF